MSLLPTTILVYDGGVWLSPQGFSHLQPYCLISKRKCDGFFTCIETVNRDCCWENDGAGCPHHFRPWFLNDLWRGVCHDVVCRTKVLQAESPSSVSGISCLKLCNPSIPLLRTWKQLESDKPKLWKVNLSSLRCTQYHITMVIILNFLPTLHHEVLQARLQFKTMIFKSVSNRLGIEFPGVQEHPIQGNYRDIEHCWTPRQNISTSNSMLCNANWTQIVVTCPVGPHGEGWVRNLK